MDHWGQYCDISVYNIDYIINSTTENSLIRRNRPRNRIRNRIKINETYEEVDEKDEILDEFILIKSLFRRTFNVLHYVKNYLFYKK